MPHSTFPPTRRRRFLALLAALPAGAALAQPPVPQAGLPAEVEAALARARVPASAVGVWVSDTDPRAAPRLAHQAQAALNPASVMKLVTTYSALDQLGPNYMWNTPVYVDGRVQNGVLNGTLYIKGQGDPKLVMERLWLLLRRVQGLGIRAIVGDIVLDRSAFEVPPQDPGEFDGEPLRPYNASPDALLLNYKSLVMTLLPDRAAGVATLTADPRLAGVELPATVPLGPGDCGDWRGGLKADFTDPNRIRFNGAYPASCGERVWPLAYPDPASYARRVVEGQWREIGGTLTGKVRDGRVPAGLKPAFEFQSPTLAEVIRDINKYSNNVMAQQLFLTLGLALGNSGRGTPEAARDAVGRWWRERFGEGDAPLLENGSGLSRNERVSARALGRMLQQAWASPVMPELAASLPISGVDGTLRRNRARLPGSAHLKSGSLRDVVALAGYVDGASGRRAVFVAIVNHPNANAARPALDALIEWTAREF